jgi:hypothetical protein
MQCIHLIILFDYLTLPFIFYNATTGEGATQQLLAMAEEVYLLGTEGCIHPSYRGALPTFKGNWSFFCFAIG